LVFFLLSPFGHCQNVLVFLLAIREPIHQFPGQEDAESALLLLANHLFEVPLLKLGRVERDPIIPDFPVDIRILVPSFKEDLSRLFRIRRAGNANRTWGKRWWAIQDLNL
jgi:hypothetical protein